MTLLIKDALTKKVLGEVNLPGSTAIKDIDSVMRNICGIELGCKPIKKGETK